MFDLTRAGLSATDRKLVDAFEAFLRETPRDLAQEAPESWPDHFPSRLAFEAWRQRWLAYLVGLADGPIDRE